MAGLRAGARVEQAGLAPQRRRDRDEENEAQDGQGDHGRLVAAKQPPGVQPGIRTAFFNQ